VTHLGGYGTADASGRPVTPQTPFVIGSNSKSFTALGVMQLVGAGKIELDAPVRRYLPSFRLADPRHAETLTVRHLLNQTSGIPTTAGTAPFTGPIKTLAQQVDDLALAQPRGAPGASFEYSNANYEVLGRLIEVASGEDYAAYVERAIFAPLAMQHSTASLAKGRADGLGSAYQIEFGFVLEREPFFRPDFVPAGFLISTAEDLSHYLVAQLGGASVVSASALDLMHTGAADYGLPGSRYGMGWIVGPRNGGFTAVWHSGSTFDMHSTLELVPGSGWGVAVLANGTALPYELMQRLDLIADAVMSRVLGRVPQGTLTGLYVAFDLIVVVLFAIQIRAIVRHLRRPRARLGVGILPALLFDGVLPVAALLFAYRAFGAASPLSFLRTDVGVFVNVYAVLRLATLIARFVSLPARRAAQGGTSGAKAEA
jgi:CubicO group peptidase (beta-lactamase class C family)